MKMRYSMGFYLLLFFLIPYKTTLATSPFLYMLAHAGTFHYLLNGFGWACMWKVISVHRTTTAYILSVALFFILPSTYPVIGWSVIIYYYLGLCYASWRKDVRIYFLCVMAACFFIPHIAATYHTVMFVCGLLARRLEVSWKRTL